MRANSVHVTVKAVGKEGDYRVVQHTPATKRTIFAMTAVVKTNAQWMGHLERRAIS